MRKWVRIAVGVLLLLGVFLVPWSETEVHKRRCESAWTRLQGEQSAVRRIKLLYYKVTRGTPPRARWNAHDMAELRESRQALVELGYLIRQRFVLRDEPTSAYEAFYREWPQGAFVWVDRSFGWPHLILVTAPRSEITAVSNLVMRIDERTK